MKVKNVIELLSKLDEDEELVIDWSSKEWFEMDIDRQISEEAWLFVCRWTLAREEYVVKDKLDLMKDGLANYETKLMFGLLGDE